MVGWQEISLYHPRDLLNSGILDQILDNLNIGLDAPIFLRTEHSILTFLVSSEPRFINQEKVDILSHL